MTRMIRLVGAEAEDASFDLQDMLLTVKAAPTKTRVDLNRHGLDPVAAVGLILGGVSTADVVWKWWTKYRSSGLRLVLIGDEGTETELTSCGEGMFKEHLTQEDSSDTDSAQET